MKPRAVGAEKKEKAFVTFVLFVAFVVSIAAQSTFRARLDLVQISLTVTDASGQIVTGLGKSDFQVWEDGIEQEVTQFTDQRVPVSRGVLLDASERMRRQPVVDARGALKRLMRESL